MRAELPVDWLARLLYVLETQRPKGRSPVTGKAGALMTVTASWATGQRAGAGKFFSASAMDCSERTVQRHWRLIERLGFAVLTSRGTWLTAEQRAEILLDDEQTDRWRDRQEWTLTVPAWAAAEIPEDDRPLLERCTEQALELLRELTRVVEHRTRRATPPGRSGPTSPSAPKGPRPDPSPRPVDNRPAARPGVSIRVSPSTSPSGSYSSCSWRRVTVLRPDGRKRPGQTGATPSHSSTRSRSQRRSADAGRRAPHAAAQLARDVLERGRLPWLVRSPSYMLEATLRRYAVAGWTPQDVELAAQTRLDELTYSHPTRVERPASYLRWLLEDADSARPPAQVRDAAAAQTGAERAAQDAAARYAAAADRRAAGQARGGAGHQAARAAFAGIAGRGTRRRDVDPIQAAIDRARDRDAAAAGHPILPSAAERDHDRQCAGCGTLSPDVLTRTAATPPVAYCPSCWDQVRVIWQ